MPGDNVADGGRADPADRHGRGPALRHPRGRPHRRLGRRHRGHQVAPGAGAPARAAPKSTDTTYGGGPRARGPPSLRARRSQQLHEQRPDRTWQHSRRTRSASASRPTTRRPSRRLPRRSWRPPTRTGATVSGPGAAADREERLRVIQLAVQGQGLAGALRDPHAQAADRHPPADAQDRRLAPAARSPARRRRHRDPTRLRLTHARHPRQEARHDPALPRGRPRRARDRARGRALPRHRDPHAERDGYDAVQLGFGAVREKALTKAELGHLKKADAPPLRTLVEFRDEAGELDDRRRPSPSRRSRSARRVKVSGISKGKGFQGTIKRHNFAAGPKSHGSHNVRAPGSIGASATPSRVFKGIRGPGHMGGKRVTQRGLDDRRADPRPEPDARPRLGARARRAAPWRCAPMADAPILGGDGKLDARRRRVRRAVQRPARARGRRGRARRPPPRHARDARPAAMVRGGGAKPWRQKGTGRARAGSSALPQLDRRRHRLRPEPAPLHRQGQPQGAPRRAARARCRCTPSAARSFGVDAAGFDAPSTKQAAGLLDDAPRRRRAGGARPPRRSAAAKSLPQPRRA